MADAGTLTRADIAEAINRHVGLSRADASAIIESLLDHILDALVAGENVKISGFGTFVLRDKAHVTAEAADLLYHLLVLLAASGMSIEQMPKLYEGTDATGRLTPAVARAWGMPKRPVVAGGGGDNAAAACGIGAVTDNSALVSIGTSGVMFVSNDQFG